MSDTLTAATSAHQHSIAIAGRVVPRVGFGALHLAGPGGWGAPADRGAAHRLVRVAVDEGVRYIDTADGLGPGVSETVIAEALWPYPADLVIATKAGMLRAGPREWAVLGHPVYLRQQAHASALRLRLDSIPLFYLHRIDPAFALEDQLGALVELQRAGVIEHIGISAVDLDQLRAAQRITPIAAVQNHFNAVSRAAEDVLRAAADDGIPFVAFWALGHGRDLLEDPTVAAIAARAGLSPAELLLAWISQHSPAALPLVGTSNPVHLRQSVSAVRHELDRDVVTRLDELAARHSPIPSFTTH